MESSQTEHDRLCIIEYILRCNQFLPRVWPIFLDSYEAAIHNSSELSDVQKFTYLRSYLTDAALKSVSGLTLTNENYEKALTILKERYGNKQAIVSTHMEKLANLRVVSSDANITGLRKLFDEIESNVRVFKVQESKRTAMDRYLCQL